MSLLALLFLLNSAQDGLMCSYSLVKCFPCIIRLFDREYFLKIKTMREKVTATKWGAKQKTGQHHTTVSLETKSNSGFYFIFSVLLLNALFVKASYCTIALFLHYTVCKFSLRDRYIYCTECNVLHLTFISSVNFKH